MRSKLVTAILLIAASAMAQEKMTPEMLWNLKRVSAEGMSRDGKFLYYSSKSIDWHTEKSTVHNFRISLDDGAKREWTTEAGKTITQRYDDAWYATYENLLYKTTDSGSTWTEIYSGLQDAENVWVAPDGLSLIHI